MAGFEYYVQKIDELSPVKDRFTLKGKVALVTGAGGGIGRSTANAFADLGADVALMDIPQKKETLEHTAKVISERHGVKCICVYGDVSDPASVDAFVNEVVEKLGTIHVVHSNAGIGGGSPDGCEIGIDAWNRTLGIDLTGVLLVDAACAKVMKKHKHGGSIINTASMSGHIINKGPHGARYSPDYSLIPDAIDYGELKTGVRCDGFIASFVSLALKVGGAIGPALGGAALTWFGFVANAEQSATVVIMLNFSVTIVPAICALITLVLYLFYDLDDAAHAKIREELAERRKV